MTNISNVLMVSVSWSKMKLFPVLFQKTQLIDLWRTLADPISFIFVQFSAKILPNNSFLAQIQRLAKPPAVCSPPPPRRLGNSGSATGENSGIGVSPFGKSWIRHWYLRFKSVPIKLVLCDNENKQSLLEHSERFLQGII